jgi:hypothetical protein
MTTDFEHALFRSAGDSLTNLDQWSKLRVSELRGDVDHLKNLFELCKPHRFETSGRLTVRVVNSLNLLGLQQVLTVT